MSTNLRVLGVFALLSLLGFGGGKGIIPQMHHDSVEVYHWISNEQFTEFYTIGKLVPGPTTIMVGLIGFAAGGILTATIAVVAMFVPAAILMYVATVYWNKMPQSRIKEAIVGGLAPVVIGLMWSSVFAVGKGVPLTAGAIVIIAAITAASLFTKLSAPALILAGGVAGLIAIR